MVLEAIRILPCCDLSISAALQAIFACVFEARSTLRLKHAGMEFAVWVFKHSAQKPLERAAKPALQGLLMLLDNGGGLPAVTSYYGITSLY
jgi:hypothetical protein